MSNQTVLITGGGAGLGLAMAKVMVRKGYKVTVCGRDAATLAAAKNEVPALETIQADVARAEGRARLFAAGCPDILVNNAAITRAHDYTSDYTLSADRASAEIDINFKGPVELCRLYLEARRKGGLEGKAGAIVNIGTPGALIPLDAIPLYSASKAGFHMFTMILRRQLRTTPVKVFEVFPPSLDTQLTADLNVASRAANGPEVIAAVAEETIAAFEAGELVIAPHAQSRALLEQFPQLDDAAVDAVNAGVMRRTDWDTRRV